MPASVIAALAALVVMIGVAFLRGVVALAVDPSSIVGLVLSTGLGLLILWGMIAGHRLAWKWGRVLTILGAVPLTLLAVIILAAGRPGAAAWQDMLAGGMLLLQIGCLGTIFFALGRPSARQHFKLQCPSCGKFSGAAADFFFNRAKCKPCGTVW